MRSEDIGNSWRQSCSAADLCGTSTPVQTRFGIPIKADTSVRCPAVKALPRVGYVRATPRRDIIKEKARLIGVGLHGHVPLDVLGGEVDGGAVRLHRVVVLELGRAQIPAAAPPLHISISIILII